jgi:proteasome accessory factor C
VLTDIASTHAGEQAPDWFDTDAGDVVARIRFAEGVAPLLGDYLDRSTLDTRDGVTVATMRVADELSLRRLAARRGGLVEVLEPAGARRAVAEWADAGLAQYR